MAGTWQEIGILIAGCGSIGKRHGRVLRGLGVGDLRGCDPSAEACGQMAKEVSGIRLHESFEEGLAASPDAILICTPPWIHVPMAMQAIRSDCHVLCEKPISDTGEGIDELAVLAAETGKKVMVGLCFRYHDGIVKARRYLGEGRIGRLVSIRALMGEHLPDVRPDFRDLYTSRTTGAFDLMHDLDLALWFADLPVRKAHCVFGCFSDIDIEAPDVAEFLIEFDGPCTASVHLDFFQRPRRRQLELIGTRGVILVEFGRWDRCRGNP